jgi:amidase
MRDEYAAYDALALAQLIRRGEVAAQEALEAAIQRVEAVNPKINAVIHKLYDRARKMIREASGNAPFHGVPFLLKDLIAEYAGAPLHEGCAGLKGYTAPLNTTLVERYLAAGLVVIGKTNTPEFGGLPTTEPVLHGPTHNPWDLRLTPGGSSGGSAAAVSAGMVPMAHASDAGGSIRVPASCCGVFGLKPTRGRNPLGPRFGDLVSGLICEHAVTRSVRDMAALLDATSTPEPGDPYVAPPKRRPYLQETEQDPRRLRIGLLLSLPEGWGEEAFFHPDCRKAVTDAARLCEALGHEVLEIPASELAHPGLYKDFGVLWCCGLGHLMRYWEEELGRALTEWDVEPGTWASFQAGLKRTGADYLSVVEEVQRFSRKVGTWYAKAGADLLLSPTIMLPPVELGSFAPTEEDPRKWARMSRAYLALTSPYNMTGQPAMSVPLHWSDQGLPIGVQFAARFGEEGVLFALAAQLERARPWAGKRPPV